MNKKILIAGIMLLFAANLLLVIAYLAGQSIIVAAQNNQTAQFIQDLKGTSDLAFLGAAMFWLIGSAVTVLSFYFPAKEVKQ